MTIMMPDTDMDRETQRRRAAGKPFAVATVIRTVAPTAAKPGDKALLDEEGKITVGFLGGGCVRGAVARATKDAIANGAPQLVSLKPQELLEEEGRKPGEEYQGIRYARNGCPSKGSLDIFVEPVLPKPRLVVCGNSVVAEALLALADRFDFQCALGTASAIDGPLPMVDDVSNTFDDPDLWKGNPYVVIATQGQGDEAALRNALAHSNRFVAFVGSRRKFTALSAKLKKSGVPPETLAKVHAPAGIDIHAITPNEIALSVLAQIVAARRRDLRGVDDV